MKHLHRNDHHFQHWVAISDQSEIRPKEMPLKMRHEMIADWMGVAMTLNGDPNCREWYLERQANIPLAPKTKRWVEQELGIYTRSKS